MTDYTVRHADEVPSYSIPPLHFGGIRFSGDGNDNITWGAYYINPNLPLGFCRYSEGYADYGSSGWFSGIDVSPYNPYVGVQLSGMRYQFTVGRNSDSFPANDSSQRFVIDDAALAWVGNEPYFYPSHNESDVCSAESQSLIAPNYTPASAFDECSISEFYSFGWGDTDQTGKLRFSPHLKHGSFVYNSAKDWYPSLPDKDKFGHYYQFGFLVGNECDEIDIEFEIINEHPLIAWVFDFGACVNKKDFSTFSLVTRDSDLFVYNPKSGLAEGYYGNVSGECGSTKYNVSLRNVNCGEGDGLVQISLMAMDFDSLGENYLPYSLYDKITATGTDGMTSWTDRFSGLFWKGRYATPIAHHLTPWYNKAKAANWNTATGFFETITGTRLSATFHDNLTPTGYIGNLLDHGTDMNGATAGGIYSEAFGNYSDSCPTWSDSTYQTVGPYVVSGSSVYFCEEDRRDKKAYFLNYGGFGKILQQDVNVSPYTWNQTCEFAPVSISINSVTAKRRTKKYYATFPILGLTSSKYLTINDPSGYLSLGEQVHHVCDFDFGHLGGLEGGMINPHYAYVYDVDSNKIAIKETKTCDPEECFYSFSSGEIDSGVVRILTNQKTGFKCRFESGSEFAFSPKQFVTGDLISFDYTGQAIRNFPILRSEDYIVSHVESTMLGGDDAYKFKLRTPRYNFETAKPNKIFNSNLICSGYIGDVSAGIKEMSPNNFFTAVPELESVSVCSSVLPVLSTRFDETTIETAKTLSYTSGACS